MGKLHDFLVISRDNIFKSKSSKMSNFDIDTSLQSTTILLSSHQIASVDY